MSPSAQAAHARHGGRDLDAVLRLLVSPVPPGDPPPDWEFAAEVARRAGIEAVLHQRGEGAPKDLRSRWERIYRETQAGNLLRLAAWEEAAELFRAAAIPWLPLKGLDLLRARFYQAGERPMRDLDVLVPGERQDEACALLEKVGYRRRRPHPGHQVLQKSPVTIELHRLLYPRPLPVAVPEPEVWKRAARLEDGAEHRLESGDRLVYLCLHYYLGEVRRARSPSLLRDLARVLQRGPAPDWDGLMERARADGSLPYLARRLEELRGLLGTDAPASPKAPRGAGLRRSLGFRLCEAEAAHRLTRDLPDDTEPGARIYLMFWARWPQAARLAAGAFSRKGGGPIGRLRRLWRRYSRRDEVS